MTIDFTSALFLAQQHPHASLLPWDSLTSGRPMVGSRPDQDLEEHMALIVGTPAALLARTSMHGLLDGLTAAAAATGGTVVVDEAAYPVSHWAAAAAGVDRRTYRHHDPAHAAHRSGRRGRPVVILTDGWCGSCGRPAPLADLASVARETGGTLLVDDSLAMGVLGRPRRRGDVFGEGGAGTMAWTGAAGGDVTLVVASLAKGLGVPLAVAAGPRELVEAMRRHGASAMHASGPTAADRAALRHVMATPPAELERRRCRLARLTVELRRLLRRRGLRPTGLPFPLVQATVPLPVVPLVEALRRRGCCALALERRCRQGNGPALGVALRSDHRIVDLIQLDRALADVLVEVDPARSA